MRRLPSVAVGVSSSPRAGRLRHVGQAAVPRRVEQRRVVATLAGAARSGRAAVALRRRELRFTMAVPQPK